MAQAPSYPGANRRFAKPSPLLLSLVVLGIAAITFATLCPISLRPHLASANQERFGAYVVLGGLLALAAGRRWLASAMFVVVLVCALEAAQLLVPGRDAVISDALVKALGGVLGSVAGQFMFPLRRLIAGQLRPVNALARATPLGAQTH